MSRIALILFVAFCLGICSHPFGASAGVFIRGDADGDGAVGLEDSIYTLEYLFSSGPGQCPDAMDFTDDGAIDLGDPVFGLAYTYLDGADPADPFPTCGRDGTDDDLACDVAMEACHELILSWPMGGEDAADWVINNYVDLDDTEELLDYKGGTKTYDGHKGIDIDVPTFRSMDDGFEILAAAAGEVVDWEDDNDDRNMSCTGDWNFVKIEHDNGWTTVYGHLKKDSVVVDIGDEVEAGDVLGVVGSSGCSTHAHLHFEVRDQDDEVIDPFYECMWDDPPVYDTEFSIMDITVQVVDIIDGIEDLKDPDPNDSTFLCYDAVSAGISLAGGEEGDEFKIRLVRPDGTTYGTIAKTLSRTYRHSFWYGYWNSVSGYSGTWEFRFILNDEVVWTHELEML